LAAGRAKEPEIVARRRRAEVSAVNCIFVVEALEFELGDWVSGVFGRC